MEALIFRGGRIRTRVVAIKALASAMCIGSGGSVGREGPIVQISSSLASSIGRLFRIRERNENFSRSRSGSRYRRNV